MNPKELTKQRTKEREREIESVEGKLSLHKLTTKAQDTTLLLRLPSPLHPNRPQPHHHLHPSLSPLLLLRPPSYSSSAAASPSKRHVVSDPSAKKNQPKPQPQRPPLPPPSPPTVSRGGSSLSPTPPIRIDRTRLEPVFSPDPGHVATVDMREMFYSAELRLSSEAERSPRRGWSWGSRVIGS